MFGELINKFKKLSPNQWVRFSLWFIFFITILTFELFTIKYHLIPLVCFIVFSIFLLFYLIKFGKLYVNLCSFCYCALIIFCFVVTVFTTKNFDLYLISQLRYTLMLLVFVNFFINFNDLKRILFLLILSTIFLSGYYLFANWKEIFWIAQSPTGRIGEEFFGDVNYLSSLLAYGSVFCCIYMCLYKQKYIFNFIFIAVFFFLILRTGSRYPIFVLLISVIICLFFLLFKKHKLVLFSILAAIPFAFLILFKVPYFKNFSDRLLQLFSIFVSGKGDASAYSRIEFFFSGIDLWLNSFFVGKGSAYFILFSGYGYYTHSTIAELLCSFGIIGFGLFYFPLFYYWIKTFKRRKTKSFVCFNFFMIPIVIVVSFADVLFVNRFFYIMLALFSSVYYSDGFKAELSFETKFKPLGFCLRGLKNEQ